uniref:Uncharacterized protein n=1 Tax=Arundo donax TaxID=35708 RepID=A0A0A8YUQ2_ARUDO
MNIYYLIIDILQVIYRQGHLSARCSIASVFWLVKRS